MNNNSPHPSFELPPMPHEDAGKGLPLPEQAPARPEQFTNPAAPSLSQSSQQAPVMPVPFTPVAPVANDPRTAQQTGSGPLIADDNDLIEKEWVMKAKQIVAATRDDPHKQTREISRFKADYLKKRYNKDIKVEGS